MEACDCTTFHWPFSRIRTQVIRAGRSPPSARVTSVQPLERLLDHLADLVPGPGSGHVFPPQSSWLQSSVVPAAGARNWQAREFRPAPTPLPVRVFSRLFAHAAVRSGAADVLYGRNIDVSGAG